MLATRFIIALCPATQTYLASVDPVFREGMNLGQATVGVPTLATQFNTFEAAMDVARCITGWGGAQRVEEIAVEVEDTRSTLDTPEARIEVRDAATAAWVEAAEAGDLYSRTAAVESAMRALGLQVGRIVFPNASCFVTLYLADHLSNLLTLDWDPMQDGFSYETEGDDACDIGETEAQHEAEPDHGCAGNCAPLSPKAARALRKWGNEKCQRAWNLNRLRGEGLTVCSVETGIPVRSVNSAINAWQEVWEQLFDRDCERGAPTCDGCGATADGPADDGDDDRYYSGTGESMNDDSYTDSLNGPGTGWCG
jgi:hypothetical protein